MSICPIIDGAFLPTRQNGKTLPCVNLAAENADLRELVRDMYEKALCFYVGTGSADDLQEIRDRMRELGVEVDDGR